MSTATPEHVLESIVDGINTGDLDSAHELCTSPTPPSRAQPGSLPTAPRASARHWPGSSR